MGKDYKGFKGSGLNKNNKSHLSKEDREFIQKCIEKKMGINKVLNNIGSERCYQ